MKLRFDVTVDDIIFCHKLHFLDSGHSKRQLLKSKLIIAVSIMLTVTLLALHTGRWLVFMACGVFISLAFWFGLKIIMLKKIEKIDKELLAGDKGREMLGETEIEIQDDGLFIKGPGSTSKVYWNDIYDIVRNDSYGLIHFSPAKVQAINRSSVRLGDFESFFNELKKRTETGAKR
jgi:hypothetical protein